MAIHQISVFLENRAGQLAEITALLAKNNIDLRAINIAETSDYGVLRENGFIFSSSEVVAVGVPDEPGGLSCLLQLLAERQIDVQYMYSIFGQPNGMAYMILRVAAPAAIASLLAANGIQLADAATLGIVSAD